MKSFIIALIVLVLVISGICYYEYSIKKNSNEIEKIVENTENAIYERDSKKAKEETKKLNDKWDELKNVLMMFNDHKDLNEISQSLGMLKAFSEFDNFDEMYANLETFKLLFTQAVESSKPTLANIL